MKLALFQCAPQADGLSAALERLDRAASRAAEQAADILLTPEMYLTGYAIGAAAVRTTAMQIGGSPLDEVAGIARRNGVGILIGFPERAGDGRIYNAVQLVDRTGETRGVYRKTHLWGEIDRTQFSKGNDLSEIVEFGGWNLGFAICYDIEFPELARCLALKGADAILVATACMTPHQSISRQIIPSRAEENELFIAYCNYAGREADQTYFGLSVVAGPDGSVLAMAGEGEEMPIVTLDREALEARRKIIWRLDDRRPDLYGPLLD